MINKLKQAIIQKFQSQVPNYIIENKINVVIQLNEYFTKDNWLTKINDIFEDVDPINFIFIRNKFQIVRAINYCDAGFFFDLSNLYLNSSTKLRMIYLGVSGFEFDHTLYPNIKLYSSKGFSSSSIAEYVLANTILIINGYNTSIENKFLRRWNQKSILLKEFKSIENFKIGILGVGNNGKAISEKFKKLGCVVLGCDKQIDYEFPFIDKWFLFRDLQTFLDTIDILILCIPSNQETKHLINYDIIKKYLRGKLIINVARGNIINQIDLKRCLKEKILSGAVLDVFDKEPLSFFDSLWKFNNVIITPHISGNINRFRTFIQKDFLTKLALEFKLKI